MFRLVSVWWWYHRGFDMVPQITISKVNQYKACLQVNSTEAGALPNTQTCRLSGGGNATFIADNKMYILPGTSNNSVSQLVLLA